MNYKKSATWVVKTELPVQFTIYSTDNLFDKKRKDILKVGSSGKGTRRLIVVDENVYNLYGERIEGYFMHHNVEYKIIPIESAETTKDINTLMTILESIEDFHLLRQSEPIIAIGGGVLLDVVGFSAALYRRGVPYIRVPTTLLSLVDASIGAKTSVNHFGRRNRLGAYHVPVAVFLDRSFLSTLKRREFSNALAEILKIALLKDARLFELLEEHGRDLIDKKFQNGLLAKEVINRSIQAMLEELQPNLWEKILQRSVDFGHSFSPLIEMRALPSLSHGEAVAIDVLLSCIISNHRGMLPSKELKRIFKTMQLLELPTFHNLFCDPSVLKDSINDTMLHRNGAQNLPMINAIGSMYFINDVCESEIEKAALSLMKMAI